ncbi:hypothetical protein DM860_008700 [Cuscuta australis]|uniref:Uncharacterized protein n=1 Tax=Cuscuta australis TaxID=267555 RepID=A0A328D587_9ASTE|nr:hypothetical protein DM860_008700 [Cuscuta australis]
MLITFLLQVCFIICLISLIYMPLLMYVVSLNLVCNSAFLLFFLCFLTKTYMGVGGGDDNGTEQPSTVRCRYRCCRHPAPEVAGHELLCENNPQNCAKKLLHGDQQSTDFEAAIAASLQDRDIIKKHLEC